MKYFLLAILFVTSVYAEDKKPRKVYLKPGVILLKKSGERYQTTKGIYTFVTPVDETKKLFNVISKKGLTDWHVEAESISEIEDEIRILPNIDANVTYPAPLNHQSENKFALIDTNFNMHLENFSVNAFNSIYQTSSTSVLSPRYELRTLYISDMPVNIGIGLNYQTVTYKSGEEAVDDANDLTFTILSFGPQLERVVYTEDILSISIIGGAEFAPIYQVVQGEFKEKYNAMLFDIGIEGSWNTSYGKWSLGTHFRHHDLTLSETNRASVNPIPESITTNSIGVMAGYKYEWNL